MAWNRMHICTCIMWIWVSDMKNGRCKREKEFILQEYPVKLNLSIRYWFYGTHNQEMRCRFIWSREKENRTRGSKQRKTEKNSFKLSLRKQPFYCLRSRFFHSLQLLLLLLFFKLYSIELDHGNFTDVIKSHLKKETKPIYQLFSLSLRSSSNKRLQCEGIIICEIHI